MDGENALSVRPKEEKERKGVESDSIVHLAPEADPGVDYLERAVRCVAQELTAQSLHDCQNGNRAVYWNTRIYV